MLISRHEGRERKWTCALRGVREESTESMAKRCRCLGQRMYHIPHFRVYLLSYVQRRTIDACFGGSRCDVSRTCKHVACRGILCVIHSSLVLGVWPSTSTTSATWDSHPFVVSRLPTHAPTQGKKRMHFIRVALIGLFVYSAICCKRCALLGIFGPWFVLCTLYLRALPGACLLS